MFTDQTLSPAEARLLESTWLARVRRLSKVTHFTTNDLQCLSLIFHKMANTFGKDIWNTQIPNVI